MNGYLRQSTASQVRSIGPFIDDTDFRSLKNALTIANTDIKIKKNGAASGNKNSGGATADGAGGLYHLTWDATDTATVGELYFSVLVSGSLVVFGSYTVLSAAAYDATFANAATGYVADQPVNVTKWAGTTTTTGDIALKTTLAKTTHITGFNDVSTAQVNTECDTALADVGVTTTVTGRIDATISSRATPAQVATELTTYGALKPTAAGRTLDVSATGEAGLDWANIGAPTTTQNLSATTIKAVTDPVTLTAAYDAAKTAATQASVNAVDAVTDKLDTALELDGAVYRYTVNALENAPVGGGGGGTDWTDIEKQQIRHRIGIDGASSGPSQPPSLATEANLLAVKAKTDALPPDPADASVVADSFTTVNTKLDARLDVAVSTRATPAQVQAELGTYGALKPTVAARTLDVSANGEAGVDWANVGSPATAQNLSATTISTSQAVASVTNPVTLTAAYDAAKTAAPAGAAMTLTPAYDSAKTAASQASVNTIGAVTSKLDTALVVDGAVYQYTANALELGPVAGGGGGDASQATLLAVKAKTDALPSDPADASVISDSFVVTNAKIDAVAAKTNNLPVDPADASDIAASFATVNTKLDAITSGLPLDATELNAIADAVLRRDWTAVSSEPTSCILQALRFVRNHWEVTPAGVLNVYKENGTTVAWSRNVAADPTAQPIVSVT